MLQQIESQTHLVTTNWTAYEALSMTKSRIGLRSARELWNILTNQRTVDLYHVEADVEARALELFFAYSDKTWGVVDCASLIVMEDTHCQRVIGFDHHFVEASRQRGFQMLS